MARLFTSAGGATVNVGDFAAKNYPCTFSAWVYPTSTAGGWLLTQASAGGGHAYIGLVTNSGLTASAQSGVISGATYVATTAAAATNNAWNHVAGVFLNTSSRSVYLNGGNKVTNTATATLFGFSSFNGTGAAWLSGNAGTMNGRLADLAMWSVDLTDAEIAALAQGVSPQQIRRSALVFHWPLWGVASPEPDLSGGQRNGGVSGSPALANHAPVGIWTPR